MGKRSDFARRAHDVYDTIDPKAVRKLLPHLPPECRYVEPFAGKGDLIAQLAAAGHECVDAADLIPRAPLIRQADAFTAQYHLPPGAMFISNPVWTRALLHPLIYRLMRMAPCWLLFDADWMHTQQAQPFMPHCLAVVSVGRVRWIPGSKSTGKDNCAWYFFDGFRTGNTVFYNQ